MKVIRVALGLLATANYAMALPAQQLLTERTVLVYQTPDGTEREWLVDEVTPNIAHGGRGDCMRVRFAAGGPTAGPDERLTCVAGDTLLRWSTARSAWLVSRPIAPHTAFDLPLASGTARYSTRAAATDTISSEIIPIVETEVLTLDTAGVAIRRLTERYAPGLGTATWGRFEVRDTTLEPGWRVSQEFRLIAIRRPAAAP